MAKLFLSLTFLLLIHGCLAQSQKVSQEKNLCNFQRINARSTVARVPSEAGFTDFFNNNQQEFQCPGVEMLRHQIQPRGLLLPYYTIAPILFYVQQGNGVLGVIFPGCPETYELSQQFQGDMSYFQDRHQKIHHFRQGDILAIPVGTAHWIYNDGQDDLVLVTLIDTMGPENELDQHRRRFFLAGSSRSWGRPQDRPQENGSENIFKGIDVEIIAEAFNVDQETARTLQSENDRRGIIVRVKEGLQVVRPPVSPEQGQNGQGNGLDETICSMKLNVNIDDASKANIFNKQVGWTTIINGVNFPVLKMMQLSIERGVLYEHGIVSPHWMTNAHNIIYVTNGNMRVQIVNEQGREVFNDQVAEGQVVVVPQAYAVVKQAGEQGCKWISIRTNDNAMISTLAGKSSSLRGLPIDVLTNAYRISAEQAEKLKYNREEFRLLSPLKKE